MKIKIYSILVILLTLSVACDSLVEEEVFSTLTPNNFFQNEKDVETALVGVYDGIQDNDIWWRMFYLTELTGGTLRHQWNPGAQTLVYESDFGDAWQLWVKFYNVIGRANSVLAALEESSIDDSIKERYEGEVRFIRAYVYFYLAQIYGQVPIVSTVPESLSEAVTPDTTQANVFDSEFLKQRDRADIYQFIIEDLKFAEDKLPVSVSESEAGLATRNSASGMLARVYLRMAGKQYDYNTGQLVDGDESKYSLASEQCSKVISSGENALLSDYNLVYEEANNEEILFAIQYLESAVAGVTGEGNQIVARTGIRGTKEFTPYGWFQSSVNEPFWIDYLAKNGKEDNRYSRTFLEYYVESNGDTIWHGSSAVFKRPHVRKFLTDLGKETSAQFAEDYGADWIVLRYSDILLMQSEALNEIGGTPNDATLAGINEVRERAGQDLIELGVSKDELRELIWQERKWELCFEGLHYFDCQRTGRLLEEFALYPNPKRKADISLRHYIYPIPFNAIEANPSLNQNAGW